MESLWLSPRRLALGALLAVLALLLGARFLLVRGPAPAGGEAAAPLVVRSAPAPARKVVVHVVGAVARPGLYRVREGARVADALARAGGPTASADTALVNLAAPVADGQQVVVPSRAPTSPGPIAAGSGTQSGPVQLSVADAVQLDALPGIGPATAQKIIDYRAAHGPFRSVDDLDAVPGIGPGRIEQLRGLVVP